MANTTFDFNQFTTDCKKVNSKTLSPAKFVEKYPEYFDENTNPDKLPFHDPYKMMAFWARTTQGSLQSVNRDKLASKKMETLLSDDEDYQALFKLENFGFDEHDTDEDGKPITVKAYLQRPEDLNKFITNILRVAAKFNLKTLQEQTEEMEKRVVTKSDLESFKEELPEIVKQYVAEAPKLMQQKSQEQIFLDHVTRYGAQIVSTMPSVSEFLTQFPQEVDKTANPKALSLEDVVELWKSKALQKFNDYHKETGKPPTLDIITGKGAAAMVDLMSDQGFYPKESFVPYNQDFNPETAAKEATDAKKANAQTVEVQPSATPQAIPTPPVQQNPYSYQNNYPAFAPQNQNPQFANNPAPYQLNYNQPAEQQTPANYQLAAPTPTEDFNMPASAAAPLVNSRPQGTDPGTLLQELLGRQV